MGRDENIKDATSGLETLYVNDLSNILWLLNL